MGFLSEHVERVRADLKRNPPDESALMARAVATPPPRDFAAALRSERPAVIAASTCSSVVMPPLACTLASITASSETVCSPRGRPVNARSRSTT